MAEDKLGRPGPAKPLVRPAGESPARRPGQPGSVDEDRAAARTARHVPSHAPKTVTDDAPRPVSGGVGHGEKDRERG